MGRFLILPLFLVTASGFYFYCYLKRIVETAGISTKRTAVRIVMVLAVLVFVVPAVNIWGFWAVVVLHAAAFGLCMDFLNLIVKRAGKNGKFWRILYGSGILPVMATGMVLVYGFWNMNHVQETQYTVYTDCGIRNEGYRICLISDLHYGEVADAAGLNTYCERIREAGPDILVLAGDIVDEHTTKEELQEVFRILAGTEPELGICYVYGNHDRGLYSPEAEFTPDELEKALLDAGIQILSDETTSINGDITVIGREDRTNPPGGKRADLMTLMDQADPLNDDTFYLLLDHQPRNLEENAALGIDLQLSGHTHGGQIWPVGEICELLGFGELNYGYRRIGDFQVIVSSGMAGWGYPIRTGKHSEYVVIDLLRTDPN